MYVHMWPGVLCLRDCAISCFHDESDTFRSTHAVEFVASEQKQSTKAAAQNLRYDTANNNSSSTAAAVPPPVAYAYSLQKKVVLQSIRIMIPCSIY